MRKYVGSILLLGVLAAGSWLVATGKEPPVRTETDLEQMLKKATVNGKYSLLLAQFKVENDQKEFGDFRDLGLKERRDYADQKDLPKGYWVYVYPYWYVWRDSTAKPRPKRPWGPEQATGEPDTNASGDIVTAWASQTPDGQEEWLLLEYAEPIVPTAVLVYETYNPGALVRVTAFKLDGEEVELWKGQDPTTPDNAMGTSEIPVKANFKTKRIKLYLDSPNVPGWNEIDAVGVRDKAKKMHWAVAAEASTTYAPPFDAPQQPRLILATENDARIEQLQKEIGDLKKQVEKQDRVLEEIRRQLKEMAEKKK
jgi:hypothetical protein